MAEFNTESVWIKLSADLRRFIRRSVSDDHVTDDLLQEAFVRIHRALPSLNSEERLAAWLHQIARNTIRDHYRRISTANQLSVDDVAEISEGPHVEKRSQVGQWLPELIGQIPEIYREALTLSELDGLTQQEVADRLGISLSGAKSRVQRGRTHLREVLGQCCTFQFDHSCKLMDCDPRPGRSGCNGCDNS